MDKPSIILTFFDINIAVSIHKADLHPSWYRNRVEEFYVEFLQIIYRTSQEQYDNISNKKSITFHCIYPN